jgi:hypothetical protein
MIRLKRRRDVKIQDGTPSMAAAIIAKGLEYAVEAIFECNNEIERA